MHRVEWRRACGVAVFLAVTMSGCGDSGTEPEAAGPAAKIEIAGGDEQEGPVGLALAQQLRVRVTDAEGDPTSGRVRFVVISGGGSIQPATVLAGPDGDAVATWTLGNSTSAAQVVRARLVASASGPQLDSVTFTAVPVAGAATQIEILGGDDQLQPPQTVLADSFVVRVRDVHGNPVTNRPVTWSVIEGSGATLSESTSVTDAGGVTGVRLTLGAEGEHRVRATSGTATVTFHARSTFATHPAGTIVRNVPVPRAFGVDVSSAGHVAVTGLGGKVYFTDTLGRAPDSMQVGDVPASIAFEPGTSAAWVSRRDADAATRVDAATVTAGTTVPAPDSPFALTVSPDGGRLFVASDDSLRIYALPGGARIGRVPLGRNSEGLAFSQDGSRLYVGMHDAFGGAILEVDAETMLVTRGWADLGGRVQGVAAYGGYVYGVLEHGVLLRIEVETNLGGGFTLPGSAYDVEITPDGRELYILMRSMGQVHVHDRVTGAFIRAIDVGGSPVVIAFNRRGGRAFVANQAGYLTIID